MNSRIFRSAFVVAATAATVVAGSGFADASTTLHPPARASSRVLPAGAKVTRMTVSGVNRQIAEAHGFKVVTGPGGIQHAVPTPAAINPDGTPYRPKARPNDVVEGDCGDSYLWIHAVGGYVSEIETGFDLDDAAIAFYWRVNRSDPYGSDSNSWGGGLGLDTSWSGEWDVHGGGPGWETAGVVTPASDALLWDGDICASGGPSDAEEIV